MTQDQVVRNISGESYSYPEFFNTFTEICLEHQNSSKALAFGFILYDFKDAQIAKALNDPIYWRSLDAITGDYLTVFSINFKEKKRPRKRPGNTGASVNRLVDINYSENPSFGAFELLEQYFDVGIDVHFPALLLFQVKNGQVFSYTIVQLREESMEEAFKELRSYLEKITDTLKKVTEKSNVEEIYVLVKQAAESVQAKNTVINSFKGVLSLHRWVSIISGLAKYIA